GFQRLGVALSRLHGKPGEADPRPQALLLIAVRVIRRRGSTRGLPPRSGEPPQDINARKGPLNCGFVPLSGRLVARDVLRPALLPHLVVPVEHEGAEAWDGARADRVLGAGAVRAHRTA